MQKISRMYIWILLMIVTSCAPNGYEDQNVTNLFEFIQDPSTEIPFEQIRKLKNWNPISKNQLSLFSQMTSFGFEGKQMTMGLHKEGSFLWNGKP
ncbi:Hypothetical protein LBF_3363 [Leptospira biflexa serovar Patoc strain 'Patoc 1 (Ames)']|uniref:Lipoprotein n=1 Tax=Leptospira biflexa serovar Patoc (strain Patoc 1 / ATCC 23582 / Paris) TaxID=456481 RepID=B0SNQ6_LEPBP|nr:Hypothetical protein LBF_3363 [Leptospira biflexa serovar Patoc strain 'Patoc 1 (Ames)']ABZ97337.1 Hypothetical protein; putative signal peptide [Leptospira biflexa serovar Patoc strain 'Patoc 1 (Paris)']